MGQDMRVWGRAGDNFVTSLIGALLLVLAAATAEAAPPPLSAYGALPQTEDLALSPNGEMFARISTEGETRRLIIQKVDGGVVWRARVGDLKVESLEWANDDYLIVYTHASLPRSTEIYEWTYLQGIIVDVKGQKASSLPEESPDYVPAIFGRYGFVEQDGHVYGYFGLVPLDRLAGLNGGSMFKQQFAELYRIDLASRHVQRVESGVTDLRSWALGV